MGRGRAGQGARVGWIIGVTFAVLLAACGNHSPTAVREPMDPPGFVPISPGITPSADPGVKSLLPSATPDATPTAIPVVPSIPPRPTKTSPLPAATKGPPKVSTPIMAHPPVLSTRLTLISKEIGLDGEQRTEAFGVGGTDLGSVFDWNGKTYMVFGDTFSSFEAVPPSGHRQNTMAFSSDSVYADGLDFEGWITDRRGYAKQLFSSDNAIKKRAIPTHGVAIGGTGYIFYQQVTRRLTGGNWDVDLSSVFKSTDSGETWSRVSELTWDGSTNFAQVAFYKQGGYVYGFGTPSGRHGGVRLMRVAQEDFEDKARYEYLSDPTGAGTWVLDNESAAVTIVPPPVGESSITYNQFLERYLMLYVKPGRPGELVFRTSPELVGPWSQEQVVATSVQYPFMYAPYTKDDFIGEDGKIVYFRLSRNDKSDYIPYSTYWMKLEFSLP